MGPSFDHRSALVVVDLQNDFADAGGSLHVPGGEDLLTPANELIDEALAAGAFVAYSQDWHPRSTPHFAKDGGIWPVHCVASTWGAQFVTGLKVVGPVIRKGVGGEDGYSAFTVRDPSTGAERDTGLGALLRQHGIERLILVGLATDYCVKETALDGRRAGLDVTVLTEVVRAVDLHVGDGARALEELAAAGVSIVGPEPEKI